MFAQRATGRLNGLRRSARRYSLPSGSFKDWVTYGDHAVSAKAVPSADDGWVDLVPEEMLWSRSGAQPAPQQVRAWSNGDQASPEGIDLLEKHTYLVLLVRRHTTGEDTTWVAMDTLAFDDDVVGQGPASSAGRLQPVLPATSCGVSTRPTCDGC